MIKMDLIASLLPADAADALIATFIHDLERLAGLLDRKTIGLA
jgi:aspartokinase/homoserine dehydrogenase 2